MLLVLALVAQPAMAKRDSGTEGGGKPHIVPPGQAKKIEAASHILPPGQANKIEAASVPPAQPQAQKPPAAPAPPAAAQPEAVAAPASGSQGRPQPGPIVASFSGPQARAALVYDERPASPPAVAAPVERPPGRDASPPDEEPASPYSAPPLPGLNVPTANGLASWPGSGLALGALLGGSAAALGVRVLHSQRIRPAPAAPATATPPTARLDLASLLRRAQRNPFDGEARFRLGLELLERGREQEALRYLAQAFRYHPQAILEVLREPRHAHVRNHAGVRLILQRFQREASRRLWTGYS